MDIYLFYEYKEEGPVNLTATSTREKLVDLFEKWIEKNTFYHKNQIAAMREELDKFVKSDTKEDCFIGLGWGGPIIKVTELF